MEIMKKYPIILSILIGIVTIAYGLMANFTIDDIIKNAIIVIVVTFVLSFILKMYLDTKVFYKEEEEEDATFDGENAVMADGSSIDGDLTKEDSDLDSFEYSDEEAALADNSFLNLDEIKNNYDSNEQEESYEPNDDEAYEEPLSFDETNEDEEINSEDSFNEEFLTDENPEEENGEKKDDEI